MIARFAVLAACIGAVAVIVPQSAPDLLGTLVEPSPDPAPERVAAAPAPVATPAAEERERPGSTRSLGGRRTALTADELGHYQTDAYVHGRTIPVVVDTGATSVALNAATARRLGFHLTSRDFSVPISTANGTATAAPVKLREVRIGSVSVRNVEAVVVPGDLLPVNLLGMSFLNRLSRFEVSGGRLVLVE